ncbi:hypothetical protein ACFLVZ_00435 [Chloroflexota bacterium]
MICLINYHPDIIKLKKWYNYWCQVNSEKENRVTQLPNRGMIHGQKPVVREKKVRYRKTIKFIMKSINPIEDLRAPEN